MIIEYERDMPENFRYISKHDANTVHHQFLEMHRSIENQDAHAQLQDDLIEHDWRLHGK
jgi:hypothetical protein